MHQMLDNFQFSYSHLIECDNTHVRNKIFYIFGNHDQKNVLSRKIIPEMIPSLLADNRSSLLLSVALFSRIHSERPKPRNDSWQAPNIIATIQLHFKGKAVTKTSKDISFVTASVKKKFQ